MDFFTQLCHLLRLKRIRYRRILVNSECRGKQDGAFLCPLLKYSMVYKSLSILQNDFAKVIEC
jgi:hypothetical protein